MSLPSFPFRIQYGASDDRLHDFYIPALERSVRYDRSSGFFSSSALAIAAAGVSRFIRNGGKMRLLCGAQLSPEDVRAIGDGSIRLEQAVSDRMERALELPEEGVLKERLEALSWMVAHDLLEIRVVLPLDRSGQPLPADESLEYYHPKEGCFTDAEGNRLGFTGSSNESARGWQRNYEVFTVYTSWPRILDGEELSSGKLYIAGIQSRFEELWQGRNVDWVAMDVPRAVKEKLLRICPGEPPEHDPLERTPVPQPKPPSEDILQRDRVVFRFLQEAPHLSSAGSLGMESCTINPWPHQVVTVTELLETFPRSYMLCDEVGLGKTIEAGLVLRQLIISGRIKRALLLVPSSVMKQWQEELYEKFALNIPRYENGVVLDVLGRIHDFSYSRGAWNSFPFLIASSHLARRRDRQAELAAADPWDLLIVDEAHHARRKDFLADQYRPNRLLELLIGSGDRPGIRDKARCIYLLTATPMQVDPREVWDLLRVIRLGGKWGASDRNFTKFFEEFRVPFDSRDWEFLLDMVRDQLEAGGKLDSAFEKLAQEKVGPVDWKRIRELPFSHSRKSTIAQLDTQARACLEEFVSRHTPVHSTIKRSTRNLLRKYREKGILKERVPTRKPEQVWVTLRDEGPEDERSLYDRIEDYIADFYRKYEARRVGKGFIMTVYRRRLTSSFHALRKSLERRVKFLQGVARIEELYTDDDVEDQDDLLQDLEYEHPEADPELAREELRYVEDFVRQLTRLSGDSKLERLFEDLRELIRKRSKAMVFTQYTDTMDYLRDKLRSVYGSQVACYSGRGGEVWNGLAWQVVGKEQIKKDFKTGDHINVLLCTESASEGLNLQTCGVLINYDMSWNPMRVEQRIGRIDRIGQVYDEVWIRNYFINETVESVVYQRLSDRIEWFKQVVGPLQPILQRVARLIENAAMTGAEERQSLLDREIESIRNQLESQSTDAFDLDSWVDDSVTGIRRTSGPATLEQMEKALTESPLCSGMFDRHPSIEGAYLLRIGPDSHPVTFKPAVFDEHPYSTRFMTWGEPLLDELLENLAEKGREAPKAGIAFFSSPATGHGAFFGCQGASPSEILDLETIRAAAVEKDTDWTADQVETASRVFSACEQQLFEKARAAEAAIRSGEELALKEEARLILLEAASLEYARLDLLEGKDASPTLSQALDSLARKGYPWRGLSSFAGQIVMPPALSGLLSVPMSSAGQAKRMAELEAAAGFLLDKVRKVRDSSGVVEVTPAGIDVVWLQTDSGNE